jgi:type II secretory pathway pseudopilin PulG
MHSAGQGNAVRPVAAGSRFDDGGYILVALLIGMAVSAVWMGSLLPSWHQQAVREREAELIFRGEQYARAIALYRRKNGTLPPNIDVLVSQHYLRRKYLDPITGKDFMPLGGVQTIPATGPASAPGASIVQGGITGVRSTSNDVSIKVYFNQTTYSQWPFDWTTVAARMGGATGMNPNLLPGGRGGVGPGGAGRGGRGQPGELPPIFPNGPNGRGRSSAPPAGRGGAGTTPPAGGAFSFPSRGGGR